MSRLRKEQFFDFLVSRDIPVSGIGGQGNLRKIHFKTEATDDHRRLAEELKEAFDWSEPTLEEEAEAESEREFGAFEDLVISLAEAVKDLRNTTPVKVANDTKQRFVVRRKPIYMKTIAKNKELEARS